MTHKLRPFDFFYFFSEKVHSQIFNRAPAPYSTDGTELGSIFSDHPTIDSPAERNKQTMKMRKKVAEQIAVKFPLQNRMLYIRNRS
jgi:hypothetical protein